MVSTLAIICTWNVDACVQIIKNNTIHICAFSESFRAFRHAGTRPRTRRSPSMRSATFAHEINVPTTLQHVTHQYHHSGAMPHRASAEWVEAIRSTN